MNNPLDILKKYWGFNSFRSNQFEIINTVLENQDCLILLPTGGGKSICFQIPALMRDGICIVISPLISLIKDQVDSLNKKAIKAITLTDANSQSELIRLLDNCLYGNIKFLYTSPEKLEINLVKEKIKMMKVNFIAVDEAHCISQWGHDFRPAYMRIKSIRDICPKSTLIALTATATSSVSKDICKKLNLIKPKIFKNSFFRNNISYNCFITKDKISKSISILNKSNGSAILYLNNRYLTEKISNKLNSKGISSDFYHGGMDTEAKKKKYKKWMGNKTRVIVATNAFGMGIDKSDVETIIHLSIPDSIESYVQETGRAGRNGIKANSYLIIEKNGLLNLKMRPINRTIELSFLKIVYYKLNMYLQVAFGELSEYAHDFNFNKFCNTYKFSKQKTYKHLKFLEQNGIIFFKEKFKKKILIQFNKPLKEASYNSNISKAKIINYILRLHSNIYHEMTEIDIDKISLTCNIKKEYVINTLKTMELEKTVKIKKESSDSQIKFLFPREDDITINKISKNLKHQNEIKKLKFKAVLSYIKNSDVCRSKQLLNYFDEKILDNCGSCDVCQITT